MCKSKHEVMKPAAYIRDMFASTDEEGKLSITYNPGQDVPSVTFVYAMDWTAADAEKMVRIYEDLVEKLERIGQLHQELEDPAKRAELLTAEELAVWDTYIRPYDPFDADNDLLFELYDRGRYNTLEEAEQEVLERHYQYLEDQSRQRLPEKRTSAVDLIAWARRYAQQVADNAPQSTMDFEGCHFAETLVMYHHLLGVLSYP